MSISFRPLKISDKELFTKYTDQSKVVSCDKTFAIQFLWKDYYQSEVAEIEDHLVIKCQDRESGSMFFFPPFGDKKESLCKVISVLKDYAFGLNKQLLFIKVTDEDLSLFREIKEWDFTIKEERDHFEYIYLHTDYFDNKRLKQKLRYFERDNKFSIVYLTSENIDNNKDRIIKFYTDWIENKAGIQKDFALDESNYVIGNLFDYYVHLDLTGLLLEIDGVVKGFYIGEKIKENDTAFTFFVKSDTVIDYISDAIFYYGSKNLFNGCKFVNWDRDSGFEGLRFFKERYHPCNLLKSYNIIFN